MLVAFASNTLNWGSSGKVIGSSSSKDMDLIALCRLSAMPKVVESERRSSGGRVGSKAVVLTIYLQFISQNLAAVLNESIGLG
ncbi:hypothetical protein DY000_02026518 [Brassica cretica]|uniref:Uncharacterized protein n=1 Tax=Brassica cretica TaxID=69181 RepID=A0ABQ7EIP2_BRACR|nr:hypothetical protein DY000_02026518 [Brassica cretica]